MVVSSLVKGFGTDWYTSDGDLVEIEDLIHVLEVLPPGASIRFDAEDAEDEDDELEEAQLEDEQARERLQVLEEDLSS